MFRLITVLALLIAANFSAAAATVHIVAFGDSMTAGWLVPRKDAYPAQLQAALQKKGYDVAVDNAGINGGTFLDALLHFDEAIAPGTDIAIVEFGTNDLRQRVPMKTVRSRLTEIVRTLRARKIEVLVIGLGSLKLDDVARARKRRLCAMESAARQISRARSRALQRARLCNRGRAHAAADRDTDRARRAQMTYPRCGGGDTAKQNSTENLSPLIGADLLCAHPAHSRASSRGVLMMEPDAAPARGDERSSPSRAAPGHRPGPRAPARSSLTAGRAAGPRLSEGATSKGRMASKNRKARQELSQKARPGAAKTPRMARREAPRAGNGT